MASAVLGSQNESSWALMGKTQYANPHLNPNPHPNPKKKQKQFHPSPANGAAGRYRSISNNNVDSPAVTRTASDDANSFNQTPAAGNVGNYGGYLTFYVATYTKSELLELRKRLSAELDQIRDLRDRIDFGRFNIGETPRYQPKSKKYSGSKRPGPAIRSTPKRLNDGYENSSLETVNFGDLLKECEKIVTKLIKGKFGYVFKDPVDAVALKLVDYHLIVKHPMDLGTVKANLAKTLYRTPVEFAADVRLTFNNALLYNPKTDPVHGMTEEILARFEEMFRPVQEKFNSVLVKLPKNEPHEFKINDDLPFREVEELQGSSWNSNGCQALAAKKSKRKGGDVPVSHVMKKSDRMQDHSTASTLLMNLQPLPPEPLPPSPVRAPPPPAAKEQKPGRVVTPKQPKPRAKDVNKRDMSMDEKQKLGFGLQNLPQEKMPQLVQIIRKRDEHLAQDGDEIELDIEALDTETLWELDRFVTNWKKMVSKTKRQALMMNNNPAAGVSIPSSPVTDADVGASSDKNDDCGKKMKENDEEDVDIDDDMPAASFPAVEIEIEREGVVEQENDGVVEQENDGRGNASSSSSSSGSSSSSSSSDSDSGSSSGSESDADDAQS
ncbi:transcription factor GTE2-like [Salvia splendens]|uniref:transcription factor GTE2-like n=1 Tax=Salvia splendens TaxID=180675 RepID=UPI001C2798A9|nr:transcription factor GTE2-like [Salvia splendens]